MTTTQNTQAIANAIVVRALQHGHPEGEFRPLTATTWLEDLDDSIAGYYADATGVKVHDDLVAASVIVVTDPSVNIELSAPSKFAGNDVRPISSDDRLGRPLYTDGVLLTRWTVSNAGHPNRKQVQFEGHAYVPGVPVDADLQRQGEHIEEAIVWVAGQSGSDFLPSTDDAPNADLRATAEPIGEAWRISLTVATSGRWGSTTTTREASPEVLADILEPWLFRLVVPANGRLDSIHLDDGVLVTFAS